MYIRAATKDDIPVMTELLHELFAIETDFTADNKRSSRGLELLFETDTAEVFVAEIEGRVVGMCTVQILISTAEGSAVGTVEDVVVDSDHRGKGVGPALLQALEEWAATRGLARLQLLADHDNHNAIRFYRLQGWNSTHLTGWIKKPLHSKSPAKQAGTLY